MKFARYLENAQTPEWKKAYIDYKGLKKQITKIRESHLRSPGLTSSNAPESTPQSNVQPRIRVEHHASVSQSQPNLVSPPSTSPPARRAIYGSMGHTPPLNSDVNFTSPSTLVLPPPAQHFPDRESSDAFTGDRNASQRLAVIRSRSDSAVLGSHLTTGQAPASIVIQAGPEESSTSGRNIINSFIRRRPTRNRSKYSFRSHEFSTLSSLYAVLSPIEMHFFELLDHEVDKVETFYTGREADARTRYETLQDQFRELQHHRKIYHESNRGGPWNISHIVDVSFLKPGTSRGHPVHWKDPDEYQHAKKELKTALLEFYRFLELLKNYRIINATGFRKSLKKFDKTAHLSSQDLYLRKVVDTKRIANGDSLESLIKEVEGLYASRFSNGDRKKAQDRLRGTLLSHKTHHISTFKSGLMIGLAVPAFVAGLWGALQSHTQEVLPEWSALLFIYAVFAVPALFAFLVGINVHGWKIARINWVFIFELDARTAMDAQQYFELPAFMLSTLSYAFYLSFSLRTVPVLHPTWLPLVWLGIALVTIINPFPFFFKSTRWWFLRVGTKLFYSIIPLQRVEFVDFWLGDQFCSLVFTLSNLYFVVCAYETTFKDPWQQCTVRHGNWGIYFLLASLPSIIRTMQSIKRYHDSDLYTHLINAGKYASSILSYLCYYGWRRSGTTPWYIAYILTSVVMSIYTSSWDLLMDWSFLHGSDLHPLLRSTLLYPIWIPIYYCAMVINVAIRFAWIIYVCEPNKGLPTPVRSFIAAILEMCRRLQWNFFRLENEHIGNTDQYRVIRDVPLPYRLDNDPDDAASEDEDESKPIRMPELDSNGRRGADDLVSPA